MSRSLQVLPRYIKQAPCLQEVRERVRASQQHCLHSEFECGLQGCEYIVGFTLEYAVVQLMRLYQAHIVRRHPLPGAGTCMVKPGVVSDSLMQSITVGVALFQQASLDQCNDRFHWRIADSQSRLH